MELIALKSGVDVQGQFNTALSLFLVLGNITKSGKHSWKSPWHSYLECGKPRIRSDIVP